MMKFMACSTAAKLRRSVPICVMTIWRCSLLTPLLRKNHQALTFSGVSSSQPAFRSAKLGLILLERLTGFPLQLHEESLEVIRQLRHQVRLEGRGEDLRPPSEGRPLKTRCFKQSHLSLKTAPIFALLPLKIKQSKHLLSYRR